MLEGSRLLREGKDHLALVRFVESSTLDPYNALTFNKMAITYSRLARFPQAQKAVTRALRLYPEYANAHNTRGILHLANHRYGKAARSFREAIRLDSTSAVFQLNLGTALLNQGDYRAGRVAYQRALQLDPEVFDLEGVIQVATSDPQPAPEKFFQMSVLFAELGDADTCLYYLGKALADGFRDWERLTREPALSGLREESAFVNLLASYGLQAEASS